MRGSDLALLTVGGLLIASGARQAERTAVARTRANVMRRVQRARRRQANAASAVGLFVGGGVIAYVLYRIGRDLVQDVRDEHEPAAPDVPTDAPSIRSA
jgi:hypothetical protein